MPVCVHDIVVLGKDAGAVEGRSGDTAADNAGEADELNLHVGLGGHGVEAGWAGRRREGGRGPWHKAFEKCAGNWYPEVA